jgi:hypothetical protein
VSAAIHSISTEGEEALGAATLETLLNAVADAADRISLVSFEAGFDGATIAVAPVLLELCKSTQAMAGTSTAATEREDTDTGRTANFTGFHSFTAEPTVLTTHHAYEVAEASGLLVIQFPITMPFSQGADDGICLTAIATNAINGLAGMSLIDG